MNMLWGEIKNIKKENVQSVKHREKIKIGNIIVESLHTPGHANHHIAWKIDKNIFTGDVLGAKIKSGPVLPACPPPEVDIEKWIEFFEMEPLEGRVCRNLSRGQRQKVMLAAAFISKTELLFLDEPFINLDPIVQTKVRDWLVDFVKQGGTVFLNTHLLENAQRLCNRAAIIHQGKIESLISLEQLNKQKMNLEELFHEIVL